MNADETRIFVFNFFARVSSGFIRGKKIMSAHIQGLGWVTPLGADLDEVWQRLRNGERAEVKEIACADSARKHFYFPVPPKLVAALSRNPRLRRSSAISYFSTAAGWAALENAGLKMTPEMAERTALVFAIASGGVIYTRRFYEQIVKQGAKAASPLLFPETVYNAPASHLAALLGLTGLSYTLVGDGSVGLAALKFGEQLLNTTDIEHCVVVGAEEVDGVLCEAYRTWRLTTTRPRLEIRAQPARGTLLAEGAGAVVLGRTGRVRLAEIHAGETFFNRRQIGPALQKVHADLARGGTVEAVIGCANGTFLDRAEAESLAKYFPHAPVYAPAEAWGCAIAPSGILQTILAARACETGEWPAAHLGEEPRRAQNFQRILVSCAGWNQQASGLMVAR